MQTVSVVVPVYNEEQVVEKFYTVLKSELLLLKNYISTIVFVVDGGQDNTAGILREIAEKDGSVKVIVLSRNFGTQMALLAGLDYTMDDVVITMDGDLQHPPSLIPLLLAEFEKKNDIVHAVRQGNEDNGFIRSGASKIFYKLMNFISDSPVIEGAADFRLLSRRVVEILRKNIRERSLFIRGIVNWMGFRQSNVYFVAPKRAAGHSKYSWLKLLRFALAGSVSFGRKPLRVASFVGFLFALGGFGFTIMTFVQYYFGEPFPLGWATVVILLAVFGGLQLVFLGIIGEYIGAIFDEVKARPHYLVEDTFNI